MAAAPTVADGQTPAARRAAAKAAEQEEQRALIQKSGVRVIVECCFSSSLPAGATLEPSTMRRIRACLEKHEGRAHIASFVCRVCRAPGQGRTLRITGGHAGREVKSLLRQLLNADVVNRKHQRPCRLEASSFTEDLQAAAGELCADAWWMSKSSAPAHEILKGVDPSQVQRRSLVAAVAASRTK